MGVGAGLALRPGKRLFQRFDAMVLIVELVTEVLQLGAQFVGFAHRRVAAAELVLNRFHALAQEVLALVFVHSFAHLQVDFLVEFQNFQLACEQFHSELGAFLRARRESLTPADVGLPDSGRRRTPGLRREEVAAAPTPMKFGHSAARGVRVSRERFPRTGHQPRPAASRIAATTPSVPLARMFQAPSPALADVYNA